jgi:hypothetical protein
MTIGKPKNTFQQRMLEAYDRCRSEALRKYFPELEEEEIHSLLGGNYLRPDSFKR